MCTNELDSNLRVFLSYALLHGTFNGSMEYEYVTAGFDSWHTKDSIAVYFALVVLHGRSQLHENRIRLQLLLPVHIISYIEVIAVSHTRILTSHILHRAPAHQHICDRPEFCVSISLCFLSLIQNLLSRGTHCGAKCNRIKRNKEKASCDLARIH